MYVMSLVVKVNKLIFSRLNDFHRFCRYKYNLFFWTFSDVLVKDKSAQGLWITGFGVQIPALALTSFGNLLVVYKKIYFTLETQVGCIHVGRDSSKCYSTLFFLRVAIGWSNILARYKCLARYNITCLLSLLLYLIRMPFERHNYEIWKIWHLIRYGFFN